MRSVKPRVSSNASIFEERGDPWVTPREGREKFGRNLSSEDPHRDRHLFAGKATKFDRPLFDPKRDKAKKVVQEDDPARRAVAALLAGKRKIARPTEEKIAFDTGMAKLEGAKHG